MGTNYYVVENRCRHCNRRDLVHIGKKSFGWRFFFRGYDDTRTVEQWRSRIENADGIENEYGEPVDTPEFWAMVEASRSRRDHIEHCLASGYAESTRRNLQEGREWHDDGFSFSVSEFS